MGIGTSFRSSAVRMKIGIIVAGALIGGIASGISAQTPAPSAGPSASAEPKVTVDSLAPVEMEETIRTLKSNFVDPNALKDQEIDRATLEGLLTRLHGGAMLLPGKTTNAESPAPFYSEVLGNHIGYVRIGSLSSDNLGALDKALSDFGAKKIDAMVIDLRATSSSDFNLAAEMTKRFVPKGKTLWTLRKTAAHQDRTFTNDRDPVSGDDNSAGGWRDFGTRRSDGGSVESARSGIANWTAQCRASCRVFGFSAEEWESTSRGGWRGDRHEWAIAFP